jgi:hypothetical protein
VTTEHHAETPASCQHCYAALRDEVDQIGARAVELAGLLRPFDPINAYRLRQMAATAARIVNLTNRRIEDLAEAPDA